MSKIKIGFDKKGFDRALKAHSEYKDAKKSLTDIVKDFDLDAKLVNSSRTYVAITEALYDKLSEGSTLPTGINKVKFLELMDINLVPLSQAVNKYNVLREKAGESPVKESFTRYIESEADLAKYNDLKDAVDMLNKLVEAGYIKNKIAIQNGFANAIGIDYNTTNFKLNF